MTRVFRLGFLGAAGVIALCTSSALSTTPRLIWNATASVPEGLYSVQFDAAIHVGDLVAVVPPRGLGAWLDRRGYLPSGALLIKRTAAVAPSQVCRTGDIVTVDDVTVALAASRDRAGRALPDWSGCQRLGADDIFLINAAPGSLDSRYFGALSRAAVVGRATPRWLVSERRDAH